MNKKVLIGSLMAVLMLVAVSFVSSAEVNTNVEKKESPLYRIRTRKAVGEKITTIIENIKTKFLGERLFFIPFSFVLKNNEHSLREILAGKYFFSDEYTGFRYATCVPTCGFPNTVCGDCTYLSNCETLDIMPTCRNPFCK